MKINSYYPVIMTDEVSLTAEFYKTYFAFETVFESEWYISLRMASESFEYELAVLDAFHATVPEGFRAGTQGLILNFEVEDVDVVYARLIEAAGLPLRQEMRNEAFGQRHFLTSDPSGVLIDVIQIIPPTEEFSEHYNEQIWEAGAE
ncbi:glyoxalase/bleomycin resistance/extradiol dioxygenase family protein [Paenibacillus sp. IB182496]|uniref:Glyoxalase/bleomycin resistance/extradiol dioxygenase family protein n=1 Tax=Paenibacillus sabuli TaxID=2772509 RepID=A0A927BX00_9BACL|nr:glyoxalase/bleomycin resistance/extradiol dioxygenase family protein [Paenibacillus sabuli]MBD2846984.1 glyoxalase/bleomycin resistance/extradiol dioxygenase family protein [Paenibacillus sabuli]